LIHPERLFRRRAERFRPGTIPISDRSPELRPRNSAGISVSALGIVTRGQFVSPCIRTYVGHVIHGIIHATNPRYQKIPETMRRVRLCVCVCVCEGIYIRACVLDSASTCIDVPIRVYRYLATLVAGRGYRELCRTDR